MGIIEGGAAGGRGNWGFAPAVRSARSVRPLGLAEPSDPMQLCRVSRNASGTLLITVRTTVTTTVNASTFALVPYMLPAD